MRWEGGESGDEGDEDDEGLQEGGREGGGHTYKSSDRIG